MCLCVWKWASSTLVHLPLISFSSTCTKSLICLRLDNDLGRFPASIHNRPALCWRAFDRRGTMPVQLVPVTQPLFKRNESLIKRRWKSLGQWTHRPMGAHTQALTIQIIYQSHHKHGTPNDRCRHLQCARKFLHQLNPLNPICSNERNQLLQLDNIRCLAAIYFIDETKWLWLMARSRIHSRETEPITAKRCRRTVLWEIDVLSTCNGIRNWVKITADHLFCTQNSLTSFQCFIYFRTHRSDMRL